MHPLLVLDIDQECFLHEEINGKSTHCIRKRLANRPELTQELTQGYLYWLDNLNGQDKASEADAYHYQAAILELVPMVDEETADRLFTHYPYKATEPSQYDHRPAEGYDPMVELLKDQGIPKNIRIPHWHGYSRRRIKKKEAWPCPVLNTNERLML